MKINHFKIENKMNFQVINWISSDINLFWPNVEIIHLFNITE